MPELWYIARGKQKAGPFAYAELKDLARGGGLLPNEMVLKEGEVKWRAASEVEGLFWTPSFASPAPARTDAPDFSLEPSPQLDGMVPPPPSPAPIDEVPAPVLDQPPSAAAPPPAPVEETPPWTAPAEVPAPLPPIDWPPPRTALKPAEDLPRPAPEPPPAPFPLVRWCLTAVGLSALLGLAGDLLRPLAPLNLVAFLSLLGLVSVSLLLWVRRDKWYRTCFAISSCFALGFGFWWALAFFNKGQEVGLLAASSRLVARVQSAAIGADHKGPLVGTWALGPEGTPDAELDIQEGKLTWRIGHVTKIEAEYGTARGFVYGIVTHVESDPKGPEDDDRFSFWFRAESDTLTVKQLKGKGFDDMKKLAQGKYKKRR